MKEFRLANCLVDGKIRECAIFADGSKRKIINTDDEYGKYFYVDNKYNDEPNYTSYSRIYFSNRIKDAVTAIRNGDGDAISYDDNFMHIAVKYYINREIGEKLRQKTIDGFKDAKFAYAIRFWNPNSLYSDYTIFDIQSKDQIYFNSWQSAEKFMNENIIKKAEEYAKKISDLVSHKRPSEETIDISSSVYREITRAHERIWFFIEEFTYTMLDNDLKFVGLNNNSEYKLHYKPIQTIVSESDGISVLSDPDYKGE